MNKLYFRYCFSVCHSYLCFNKWNISSIVILIEVIPCVHINQARGDHEADASAKEDSAEKRVHIQFVLPLFARMPSCLLSINQFQRNYPRNCLHSQLLARFRLPHLLACKVKFIYCIAWRRKACIEIQNPNMHRPRGERSEERQVGKEVSNKVNVSLRLLPTALVPVSVGNPTVYDLTHRKL